MSKTLSDATLLRRVRREWNVLRDAHKIVLNERDMYRTRATKAEQEAAEWKKRFDLLLIREDKQ